jgi:hypothetical protein
MKANCHWQLAIARYGSKHFAHCSEFCWWAASYTSAVWCNQHVAALHVGYKMLQSPRFSTKLPSPESEPTSLGVYIQLSL